MPMHIAPLETFELRKVWPNEAHDFTRWMMSADVLARLGRAVGIGPLEPIAREFGVGDFSADILARDPWGGPVVVENQLEASDHKHLGQAITYLAGVAEATTIIWVAARIRPEHAAAMRWMNQLTPPNIGFYAVEVALWTIEGSAPGYDFRLVVAPEDHQLGGPENKAGPLTREGAALRGFWTAFRDFLDEHGAEYLVRADLPRGGWWGRNLGQPGFNLYAVIRPTARTMSVMLEISSANHRAAFAALLSHRARIDAELGESPQWWSTEARDYIAIERAEADTADQSRWPEQHAWLLERLESFRTVFRDRVPNLASMPDVADGEASAIEQAPRL